MLVDADLGEGELIFGWVDNGPDRKSAAACCARARVHPHRLALQFHQLADAPGLLDADPGVVDLELARQLAQPPRLTPSV
jgi:hypothetical protein